MSGKNKRNLILLFVSVFAMPLMDSPAFAYVVTTTSSGKEIKWQVPSASFFLNTADGPAGNNEAIQTAMRTWSGVPTSSFVFAYAGTTSSSSHGVNDGQNIVTFAPMGSTGVLAENRFWYNGSTGQILDSDIRFNTTYSWSASGTPGYYDVQNIAAHELGHSLSLSDLYGSADSEKTLYGYASMGETKKRTLDPDDVAGIAHLYPAPKVPGDFDGDGLADIAVWRAIYGYWFILHSSDNTTKAVQYGVSGDIPVPGDYDGDGKTDIAVYRPAFGSWFIRRSSDNTTKSVQYGVSGDIPVPGDYDGDGKADIAVYRPAFGSWFIIRSSNNTTNAVQYGVSGDIPVPGDYDGDGKADIAVYRPAFGSWFIIRSSDNTTNAVQYGVSGDIPVPGDFDGDGKTDVAIFRPSTGYWFIIRSKDGTTEAVQYGVSGDIPVPGDYDGDGKTDIAIYRPSSGYWFIIRSSDGSTQAVQFGVDALGDVPIGGRN